MPLLLQLLSSPVKDGSERKRLHERTRLVNRNRFADPRRLAFAKIRPQNSLLANSGKQLSWELTNYWQRP